MGLNPLPDDMQLQASPVVLAPGAAGVSVLGIEVTQAVQDMQNSVTLIAGKTTVVRVYLDARSLEAGTGTMLNGELAWRRGNTAEAYLPSFSTVSLAADSPKTLTEQRHNLWSSLDFRLPADAIAGGSLTLRLNRLMVVGGDDAPIAGVSSATVDLHAMPPLIVRVVGLRYFSDAIGEFVSPDAFHFAYLRSFLERAFPVAQVSWSQIVVDADIRPPFINDANQGTLTAITATTQLATLRNSEMSSGMDPRTHYYGLVSDNGGRDFIVGWGATPGQPRPDALAAGPAGAPSPRFPWDADVSYADWYGAHELAHTFDRLHPGFPKGAQNVADAAFPFSEGQLSGADDRYVGFDIGDVTLGLPMNALPGQIYHDVMTYADNQWLSAYTYEAIRQRLLDEAALFPVDTPETREIPDPFREIDGGAPIGPPSEALSGRLEGSGKLGSRVAGGRFVHVVAALDLQAGTGQILYVSPAAIALEGAASNDHGVELQFNDTAGQILFSRTPQVLINACEDAAAPRTGMVNEAVPFVEGMKEALLLINGQVQSRYVAGALDPPADAGIVLSEPLPDSPHRRRIAGPPEARRSGVAYTIQARPAGAAVWQTIAAGRAAPDVEVNLNQFPSAAKVELRVLMTNGFEDRVLAEREIVVGDLTAA